MSRKPIATTLAALALVLLAGGCAPSEQESNSEAMTVLLPDGGSVVCVVWKLGYSGGISCDWGGTR